MFLAPEMLQVDTPVLAGQLLLLWVTPDPASFPGLRMYACDFIYVKYDHVTETIP